MLCYCYKYKCTHPLKSVEFCKPWANRSDSKSVQPFPHQTLFFSLKYITSFISPSPTHSLVCYYIFAHMKVFAKLFFSNIFYSISFWHEKIKMTLLSGHLFQIKVLNFWWRFLWLMSNYNKCIYIYRNVNIFFI